MSSSFVDDGSPASEGNIDVITEGITLCLYFCVGLLCLWRLLVHITVSKRCTRLIQFHAFLLSFFTCVVLHSSVTLVVIVDGGKYSTTFLESLAYLLGIGSHSLFFTALLLILINMLEIMFVSVLEKQFLFSKFAIITFWIVMFIPYMYDIGTAIYFVIDPSADIDGSPLYDTAVLTVCAYALLCGIAYCIATGLFFYRLYSLEKRSRTLSIQSKPFYILIAVMCICFTSFFLQFAMFLYRPVTGKYMNVWVFQIFAYWVPEIGSSLPLLVVARIPDPPPRHPYTPVNATMTVPSQSEGDI
ncbi:hypothetical protein Pelo_13248 [Pelomyxa schiedti]|nr:hypothetical protein Pelo_13248 [Pelomyxa schiedti]